MAALGSMRSKYPPQTSRKSVLRLPVVRSLQIQTGHFDQDSWTASDNSPVPKEGQNILLPSQKTRMSIGQVADKMC